MTTTWNPADMAFLTLSNGDLTASAFLQPPDWVSYVRATTAWTTGKHYAEITILDNFDTPGGSGSVGLGMSNASFTGNFLGNNPAFSAGYFPWSGNPDALLIGFGTGIAQALNAVSPPIIRIAVNGDTGEFWVAVGAGQWNASGTANPATGVGGLSYSISGAVFLTFGAEDGAVITANFDGPYQFPNPFAAVPTPLPVVLPASLGRWRGQCGINWQGLALIGDAFSNVVGLSDFTIFNEFGNQMHMLATTPPLHEDRKRIFVTRFEIEVEAGQGAAGTGLPTNMIFDYSKDGGVTWAPIRVFRSMGAVGEYIKRLRWINLGQSRTWVFRIQYTDTARPAIIGTYVDLYKSLG